MDKNNKKYTTKQLTNNPKWVILVSQGTIRKAVQNMRRQRKLGIVKKYIHYPEKAVFAICYPSDKVIYYNLDFAGKTERILMIPSNKSELGRYKTN